MSVKEYMDFVEETAKKFQDVLKNTKEPNRYDYNEISECLLQIGAKFIPSKINYNDGMNIYLTFYDGKNFNINENNENAEIFFELMWNFICEKLKQDMHEFLSEIECLKKCMAKDFVRAMLMPKELFTSTLLQNISSTGEYNIFAVGKTFNVDYLDCIIRLRDL